VIPPLGHDSAIAAFREGLDSGRLHHAWLISGPSGIGKALFADAAALRVLAGDSVRELPALDVPADHPSARLVEAGSHPDLMRLERLPHERTGELVRSISVDQVRSLQRLFMTTPSLSPWRVVIIDAIDELERAAANALLKRLEEPPPSTLFLLVSHASDRLLPTIRSRCRTLRLSPLPDDVMASALRGALPDAPVEEIDDLVAVGQGSPGKALAFRGLDVASLDKVIADLARRGDPGNRLRSKLAQDLGAKAAQPRYEAFLARVPSVIAAAARERRGEALADALGLWERANSLASGANHLSLEPQSVVFELAGMIATLAPGKQPAG
jgi:DNA polymerase-3 subunit delta'